MTSLERLPSSAFIRAPVSTYADVQGLHELFDRLAFRTNLVLSGPKGVGKSLSVLAWAAGRHPVVTFDCSEDTRRAQLIGMFTLRGNETPFMLGPIPTAFEVANEYGSCVLVCEEIAALHPTCQKLLNPVLDFRRRIEVPEAQRVFELQPGKKLWIVGSMNTAGYGGVYELNEDLKSRLRIWRVGYPDKVREKQAVLAALSEEYKAVSGAVLDRLLTLASETRQGEYGYAISTRDLVQIVEDVVHLGNEQEALRLLSGKFDGIGLEQLNQRIEAIFSFTIDGKAKLKREVRRKDD